MVSQSFDQLLEEGQAAERGGQRSEARALYERALSAIGTEDDGRRASKVLRWIARTYVGDSQMDEALDCLDAAIAIAEAWHDDAGAGHAINVQAVVRWQLGDLDEAERLYLTARTRALRAGDAKLAAMTAQNLGVIANVRGDLAEAQRHYEASLGEYRALGLTKDVIVALNNLGLLHTHTQQWLGAERAFAEAVQISDALGDVTARSLIDVNMAEMWVARQEFVRAQHCVKHAMELATRVGDSSSIGQASKLLGVIAREIGDAVDAEEHFRRAEEIAEARQDVLLQAEVAREAGELARRQGRNSLVLRHLNRAHRLFSQLRARRDLADIDQRTGSLEEEFLQVARRWGESIEAKDRYTQGHCVRVADLSCAMGRRLGMSDQDLFWYRIGALLHDVGKIVIPEEVLNKAGKLTEEEWMLMRSHTTAGVEMLAGIEFPWDLMPAVRSHHERWDGHGYPDQLEGEQIPLVARILCVADVYDALTSVRSYKRALTHEQAVEMMRLDVGTMFDPAVFEIFEQVVRDWVDRPERALPPADVLPVATTADWSDVHEVDDLTRMPQRRALREAAERILEARRTTERPVSLMVIDVDHFKLVNDTFGHLQGDDVLRLVASIIRAHTRPGDFVARYAGDEFVAVLPGTHADQARIIAERLRVGVEEMACPRRDGVEIPIHVSLSIGVASAPSHGESLDELFASADGAMYRSKRQGRNAVTVASGAGAPGDAGLMLESFVGRLGERQRLCRLLESAAGGRPQVVSVVGEAGIGKSTLLRQLAPSVGLQAGSLLLGRCLEADVRPPYGPWVDILAAIHALGIVAPREWRELGRLVPSLKTAGDSVVVPDPGSTSRYALIREIEEFLAAATLVRPLVVVLDDMQWADSETWDVLESLVARLSDQRLLVCITVRREDLSPAAASRLSRISRHDAFHEVVLGRLSREELEHWLRGALAEQSPDPAITQYLITQTEGNPLFAVQTLRMLDEEGSLRFTDGKWRLTPTAAQHLPTAVRELLMRRVMRLSPSTREVLVAAATFGKVFDADDLSQVVQCDEEAMLQALEEATRSLLVESFGNATSFVFSHNILADVLRRSVSALRLRRLHERIAQVLEARPDAIPADIAAHYDRAGRSDKALYYALLACERASTVYAYDAASACLVLAARHARSAAEQVDVTWRLASLDEVVGRYQSAEQRCEQLLIPSAHSGADPRILRRARRMKERLRLLRGASAADVLHSCLVLYDDAQQDADCPEIVALLMMLSKVYAQLGDDRSAERAAVDAIKEAKGIDDPLLNAEAVMRLGSTVLVSAPADAVGHYRQALDIFVRMNDRRGQLRCQMNIGVACDRAGNHPAAELSYTSAIEIGRQMKVADLTALASMNFGVLLMKNGRFEEARQRFDEALMLYSSVGNEPYRLTALYNLAHLARERGDAAGATELYGACIALAAQLGQLDVHAGATCGIGLAALAMGQLGAANEQFEAAQRLLEDREGRWFQGRELFVALEIKLLLKAGEPAHAFALCRETLVVAEHYDSYAAVWLAAECSPHFVAQGSIAEGWQELVAKFDVHARALGYTPLLGRLSSRIAIAA